MCIGLGSHYLIEDKFPVVIVLAKHNTTKGSRNFLAGVNMSDNFLQHSLFVKQTTENVQTQFSGHFPLFMSDNSFSLIGWEESNFIACVFGGGY